MLNSCPSKTMEDNFYSKSVSFKFKYCKAVFLCIKFSSFTGISDTLVPIASL